MNVPAPPKAIAGFFRRFHTILFFLAVSGGLFLAIIVVMATVAKSNETALDSNQAINGNFDEQIIEQIQQGSTAQGKPGARPSPFVE